MNHAPPRRRNFCFTLNNYTPEEIRILETIECVFIIYAPEIAPTTGTPHMQCYIEMSTLHSKEGLNKKLGNRVSFPKGETNGSAEHNIQYIQGPHDDGMGKVKPFNPDCKRRGEPKKAGKRTDLGDTRDEILSGVTVDSIAMERPMLYHQYGRTLRTIEDIYMRSVYRNFQTTGEWHFGPTQCGKSEFAFKDFSPSTHYVWRSDNSDWQDGYAQQHTVIIDEFRGHLPFKDLLTMIDSHPNHTVKRRGREPLPFMSKHVIITSALPPEKIYTNLAADDRLEQLIRRIDIWEHRRGAPPRKL